MYNIRIADDHLILKTEADEMPITEMGGRTYHNHDLESYMIRRMREESQERLSFSNRMKFDGWVRRQISAQESENTPQWKKIKPTTVEEAEYVCSMYIAEHRQECDELLDAWNQILTSAKDRLLTGRKRKLSVYVGMCDYIGGSTCSYEYEMQIEGEKITMFSNDILMHIRRHHVTGSLTPDELTNLVGDGVNDYHASMIEHYTSLRDERIREITGVEKAKPPLPEWDDPDVYGSAAWDDPPELWSGKRRRA